MNGQVDLEVVFGSSHHNPILLNSITHALRSAQIKGTFYIGYPVMASSDSSLTVDGLLVSQTPGFVAFHFAEEGQNYREYQDRLYYLLESNLGRHESLRWGRKLGVPINVVSIFPEGDVPADAEEQYPVASINSLIGVLENAEGVLDDTLFRNLSAAIQRVMTIKPTKKRANVARSDSKGAILKKMPLRQNLWVEIGALSSPNGMIVLSLNDQPGGTQCLSKQYSISWKTSRGSYSPCPEMADDDVTPIFKRN